MALFSPDDRQTDSRGGVNEQLDKGADTKLWPAQRGEELDFGGGTEPRRCWAGFQRLSTQKLVDPTKIAQETRDNAHQAFPISLRASTVDTETPLN